MARPKTTSNPDQGFIAFGSPEHGSLLGLDATVEPKREAELQEALATKPIAVAKPTKKPINKRTYERGDGIIDGWKRR